MNICLVGNGAIAECHVEAFRRIKGVVPAWVVGRRPDATREFAAKWNFSHHGIDLAEALADDAVNCAVITSPNPLHVEQAMMAMRAGKHVLLEIPLAMNLADAHRLAALAREVDCRLMICHTMRTFPALVEVKRRVASGELRLRQFVGFFGVMRQSNSSWSGRSRSWTDDILWHHAAHLVDLALWVTGHPAPEDVTCRFGPPHPTQDVMDMTLSMTLEAGELVTIAQSYNLPQFRWRALFIGEEMTLEFIEGALLDGAGNVVVPRHSIYDLTDQNREFVAAVREERDSAISAEDVLPAMQVLQQAANDAARRKPFQSLPPGRF